MNSWKIINSETKSNVLLAKSAIILHIGSFFLFLISKLHTTSLTLHLKLIREVDAIWEHIGYIESKLVILLPLNMFYLY